MADNIEVPEAVDEYEAAFNEATAEPSSAPAATAEPAKPQVDAASTEETDEQETTGNETGKADESATDTPPKAAPAEPPAAAQEPAKPAETAATPPPPVLSNSIDPKFLAQALAEAQSLREKAAAPAPAAEPQQQKVLSAADFLKPEDTAQIEKFKTEWPDEYVAVQKMADATVQAILGNRMNQLYAELNTVLAPITASLQKSEVNGHTAAIHAAHPDADQIAPAVAEWVKTQPSLHQNVYKEVLEKGTAAQVVDLLGLYKQSVGHPSAAPVTPASAAPQTAAPAKPAAPPAAAVSALSAVPSTQRNKAATVADPNDFDAAFAEASASIAVNS